MGIAGSPVTGDSDGPDKPRLVWYDVRGLCRSVASGRRKGKGFMASWLREGKQPPQATLRIIEGYLHRVARPVYLGAISLYVGWNLARTQEMIDVMVSRGIVRPATLDEKRAMNAPNPEHANVYALSGSASPSKARW